MIWVFCLFTSAVCSAILLVGPLEGFLYSELELISLNGLLFLGLIWVIRDIRRLAFLLSLIFDIVIIYVNRYRKFPSNLRVIIYSSSTYYL